MPAHTWTVSVKSDAGKGPTITRKVFGSAEQNIGGTSATVTGLQIGSADVEEVDLAITVANIKSFFMKCDCDVRVRINSETVPAQEFNFLASEGLAWSDLKMPFDVANPLTTNITKFFIFNKGTVDGVAQTSPKTATFNAGFILAQESVAS